MKIALKYWVKDPKAFVSYIATIGVDVINIILNTMFVRYLPLVFTNADVETYVEFAAILLGQIVTGSIMGYSYRLSKMHMHTALNKMFADKISSANYQLFTEVSCSKINSVSHFMWSAAKTMDCISDIITMCINVVAILVAIGYDAGWSILVPIVALYGVFLLVMKMIYKRFNAIDSVRKTCQTQRDQELNNIIDGFEILRIFNNKARHLGLFNEKCDDAYDIQVKKSKLNSKMRAVINIVETIAIGIVVIYSIRQINAGVITSAVAVSLVMYVTRIISPITQILETSDELSETLVYSKDFEMLMNYSEPTTKDRTIDLNSFDDEIKFNNVGFSYEKSSNVLSGISFTVKKGQKIGIVGKSGGGKSTIGKLMMRFYEPSSGSITIDGIDIRSISNESFANKISCVPQETMILPGSIRDNILYAKPNALEAELISAAKNANLYDFIMSLPNGFDTEVGPRGLQLSGGQKQRIALARVFLKNPDIILMDEATSALDNESETLVQKAIDTLSNDKTIITIAHRLSTIKNSDQIYVLDNHKIVEHGTHDELLKANGIYAAMVK